MLAAKGAAPAVPAIRAVTTLMRSNIVRGGEDAATAQREAELALQLAEPDNLLRGAGLFQIGAVQLLLVS